MMRQNALSRSGTKHYDGHVYIIYLEFRRKSQAPYGSRLGSIRIFHPKDP